MLLGATANVLFLLFFFFFVAEGRKGATFLCVVLAPLGTRRRKKAIDSKELSKKGESKGCIIWCLTSQEWKLSSFKMKCFSGQT